MTNPQHTRTAARANEHSAVPRADAESYCAVRSHTEALAAPLSPEDQVVQSMPDASPTKWHRAHTTWFFEEFVLAGTGHSAFDESFRYLFNSYYEAVGDRQPRPQRGMITRPDVNRVAEYRAHVDRCVLDALRDGTLDSRRLSLVELGLHHEQQHQELLLMDVLHLFSQNVTAPAYDDGEGDGAIATGPSAVAATNTIRGYQGGLIEIGHSGDGFAYDNEGPRHKVWVEPFGLEDRLVTCGDWLEFMGDGGYVRPELWLSDGWYANVAEGWSAPAYWTPAVHAGAGGWDRFNLSGKAPVDPDEPVAHVSYYEADAYARWRGARLATEAEWELAATSGGGSERPAQMHSVLWQWTSSAYSPYPGFSPAAGAVGEYNGKFMVNQQVLRGSSFATPRGHARDTYRNFYHPGSRWAFTGVRIAHDVN